jgi:hypothetical protein
MKSFVERKRERELLNGSKAGGMRIMSLAELAALPLRASSEKRLDELPTEIWSPRLFSDKARELKHVGSLECRLVSDAGNLPEGQPTLKYSM